ncbi:MULTISPECIES: hypothetical protein [Caldimonas]|uniref:hypothetical protein n=1 Tax=Caldimonas TaxID=196013 RepID=UPI001B7F8B81|nr:hypothetical protein [Caldimonas manganoxidans]GIX23534.1 MAG: hypothetical protein KatS3mg122_0765 [Caldimonas sp.]
MKIDIDRLSEEELIDLNNRVVERLRFIRQAHAHRAMLQFRIGEVVAFEPDGRGRIEGVITRYNKKSVTVLTPDGQQWRVSPGYLRKVEPASGEAAGNVVQLPKR